MCEHVFANSVWHTEYYRVTLHVSPVGHQEPPTAEVAESIWSEAETRLKVLSGEICGGTIRLGGKEYEWIACCKGLDADSGYNDWNEEGKGGDDEDDSDDEESGDDEDDTDDEESGDDDCALDRTDHRRLTVVDDNADSDPSAFSTPLVDQGFIDELRSMDQCRHDNAPEC